MVVRFFEGNKKFVEEDFNKNREHYASLSTGQSPSSLWIACSDSRVNPERIISAEMGEVFVHRNIGNLVPKNDLNLATVLEYAVKHLKVKDIVICGHSDCGAMKALGFGGVENDTYIPTWLENARPILDNMGEAENDAEKLKNIEIENIRAQIDNLMNYEMVADAVNAHKLSVHGMYYDLSTGKLEKVV